MDLRNQLPQLQSRPEGQTGRNIREVSGRETSPQDSRQVWPLLIFSLFPFCEKIIDLLGGQINDPCLENAILIRSSQQLPCLSLEPLKGFLSRQDALQGPSTHLVVRCIRNYIETRILSGVSAGGMEVPGHRQKQLSQ